MTGKWGLGAPHTASIPTRMGFDWFFGINCQRMAHTYYPVFLYENDRRYWLKNDTVPPKTMLKPGADPMDMASYSTFKLNEYAPDVMFRKMSEFIENNRKNPFFVYWATPIPHAALQAPQRWVDYYVKKFGDEKPYLGEKGYFPHRYPHAAYAAMISYLDEQVGLLVRQLKELGIYENTLIIFTSDNGPTYNGGTDSPWFNSGGPFRSEQGYGKGNLNEGGIRVPMIASWPRKITAGRVSDHISVFYDVMPTLCNIARIDPPENFDGISFLPELLGRKQKEHEFLYWEFPESGGQIAVRIGDYKAVSKNVHKGNTIFEIYNLKSDPGESTNIASQNPELVVKIVEIVKSQHVSSPNERWQFKILDDIK
jgi:arylsulfatase